VPIRVRLFVDSSRPTRVGPIGRTHLARFVDIAAAIAQAAAANRDLVGLTTFDEVAAKSIRPARTRIHTVRLLSQLANVAGLKPSTGTAPMEDMLATAYPLAQELYPDLFERDINTTPLAMHWRPLLDTRWGWVVPCIMLSPLLLLKREVAEAVAQFAAFIGGRGYVLYTFLILAMLPFYAGYLFWIGRGLSGFFDMSTMIRRKQLAAVFAALDADSAAAVERYIRDDRAMARRAAEFLTDHHIVPDLASEPPVVGDKIAVLAHEIVQAIATARDNELFVILADLVDDADRSDTLVNAVRAARARHHTVLVLVPWPADVPNPDRARGQPIATPRDHGPRLGQLVRANLIRQYQRRFLALRTELARVGASVIRVESADTLPLILARFDRIRGARGGRR
jgi:hypothetical protein